MYMVFIKLRTERNYFLSIKPRVLKLYFQMFSHYFPFLKWKLRYEPDHADSWETQTQ